MLKFYVKFVEESIVNASRTTDQLFKSNLTFCVFVFLLCILTTGAFTIDSSTPTWTGNLDVHPILCFNINSCLNFFYIWFDRTCCRNTTTNIWRNSSIIGLMSLVHNVFDILKMYQFCKVPLPRNYTKVPIETLCISDVLQCELRKLPA
jgi:hypothetical protein